jgi:hypothetical protein
MMSVLSIVLQTPQTVTISSNLTPCCSVTRLTRTKAAVR